MIFPNGKMVFLYYINFIHEKLHQKKRPEIKISGRLKIFLNKLFYHFQNFAFGVSDKVHATIQLAYV